MKKRFISLSFFVLVSSCGNMVFPTCFSDPCVIVPGQTRTDDVTKSQAAADAFEAVKIKNPSCGSYKDYNVSNTILNHYGQWKYGPSWDETWIIEACNAKWSIPFHFEADGTGHTNVARKRNLLKQIK